MQKWILTATFKTAIQEQRTKMWQIWIQKNKFLRFLAHTFSLSTLAWLINNNNKIHTISSEATYTYNCSELCAFSVQVANCISVNSMRVDSSKRTFFSVWQLIMRDVTIECRQGTCVSNVYTQNKTRKNNNHLNRLFLKCFIWKMLTDDSVWLVTAHIQIHPDEAYPFDNWFYYFLQCSTIAVVLYIIFLNYFYRNFE